MFNNENMSEYPKPWLPPLLTGPVRTYFLTHGERKTYKKGEVIFEGDYLQHFILLRTGLLNNSITNYDLSKPFMMCGIRIPWQLTGYTTFLVGEAAPLFLSALTTSEVYFVPFDEMRTFLEHDQSVKAYFMQYCSRCLRSDLDALLAVGTTSAEERFWILYAAFFMSMDANLDEEWLTLPFKLNRTSVSSLLYVSLLTIDRLYAQLLKQGMMKRGNGTYSLHSSGVRQGVEWIMRRHRN